MSSCRDVELSRCRDVKMSRCLHIEMLRCPVPFGKVVGNTDFPCTSHKLCFYYLIGGFLLRRTIFFPIPKT